MSRRDLTTRILSCLALAWFACAGVFAQTEPSPSPQKQGIDLYRSGNLTAAADFFREAVRTNKGDSVSWHYLGLTLLKQDKLKDATSALETSLELAPANAKARADLGYVLLQRGRYADAFREARHAVWADRKLAAAHYVLGLVHQRGRAPLDAFERANEAIRLDASLAGAYLLKSLALTHLAADKHTEAESFSDRMNNIPPLSRAEQRRGKYAEIITNLAEATASLETYLKIETADERATWQGQLAALKVFSESFETKGRALEQRIWPHSELTTKVKFRDLPEPSYPKAAKEAGVYGSVLLWAVFGSDGKVGDILVLRGLPHGVTEETINTARRIKYEPAAVNGRPVSTTLTIEYNF